ncbi:acyltransferase family protein, partial [Hoylesella nanceiensis]|uniref:acyltransferase family protein n=1 Tax=Hoylesella nanceiensis TaxID=425941 RepID=UPI00242E0085
MSCSRNKDALTSRPVSIELISKYRTELMGIAMLLVVLFHGYVPQSSWFYGLKRMGNVGVDVFLFLSGIGLWFSWRSCPNLKHFYKQRFLRVYPTWLLLASCFYGFHFYHKSGFSNDVFDLLGDVIAHLDFWLHGELTFWYIPALMA